MYSAVAWLRLPLPEASPLCRANSRTYTIGPFAGPTLPDDTQVSARTASRSRPGEGGCGRMARSQVREASTISTASASSTVTAPRAGIMPVRGGGLRSHRTGPR